MKMTLFSIWLGLTLGNLIVEYFSGKNWNQVARVSYFQGVALLVAGFLL